MSSDGEEAADEVCASCGKAAVDDVKLKICTACNLVKYCSVECEKNHRKQHKKACEKKSREIREAELFTQPDESFLGECPICCLPLPIDENKLTKLNSCCSKYICRGCSHANLKREMEQGLEQRCPYCREPLPKTQDEINKNHMNRIKANDPAAMRQMGRKCSKKGDLKGAIEYYTKAAALGNADAHFNLSLMYYKGQGVENNMKKAVHHWEEAAIGGHQEARFNLGCYEQRRSNYDRAAKHFIIAAKLGDDGALEQVKKDFQMGLVSKEEYEAALRGNQAAVDATKSQQREEAYAFDNLSPEEQKRHLVQL